MSDEIFRYVSEAKLLGRDKGSKKNEYAIVVILCDESKYTVYRSLKDIANFHLKLVNQFRIEAGYFNEREKVINDCPIKKTAFGIRRVVNDDHTFEKQLNSYIKSLPGLPTTITKSDLFNCFFSLQTRDLQLPKKETRKKPANKELEQVREISLPISLKHYLCINDYSSTSSYSGGQEFSLSTGAVVSVLQKNPTGWWLVDSLGIQGWAPSSYLVPVDDEDDEEDSEFFSNETGGTRYISVSDYKASRDDELSFVKGAVIKTVKRHADGWWFVRYNGREGFVPGTLFKKFDRQATVYIRKIQRNFSTNSIQEIPTMKNNCPKKKRKVYDSTAAYSVHECTVAFKKTKQYELSVNKGDNVKVLIKNNNGWWYVLDKEAEFGWVPASHFKCAIIDDIPDKPALVVNLMCSDGSNRFKLRPLVDSSAWQVKKEDICSLIGICKRVIHDYNQQETDEVTVTKGEEVLVTWASSTGWWMVRKVNDPIQRGFVPRTCFALDETDTDMIDHGISTVVDVTIAEDENCYEIARNYVKTAFDELTVYKGQVAYIIDNTDEESWYVSVEGKEGWLPSNLFQSTHEELIEDSTVTTDKTLYDISSIDGETHNTRADEGLMISKHWVSIDYNTSTSNNGSNDEQSTPIQCLVTSSLIDVDSFSNVEDIELAVVEAEKLAEEAKKRAEKLRKIADNMKRQS